MKIAAIVSTIVFSVLLVITANFAIDYLANTNPDSPPPDQVAEAQDWGEFTYGDNVGADRSGKWPTVRKHFLEEHPVCESCGASDFLNVHHIQPFHVHPELELSTENLIVLCTGDRAAGGDSNDPNSSSYNCHFRIGHDPDGPDGPRGSNWKLSNPNVRSDARRHHASLGLAP